MQLLSKLERDANLPELGAKWPPSRCAALSQHLRQGLTGAVLHPFQLLGVQFAINVEERSTDVAAEGGGGILADAMGLGKTLQCIALIIARPAPRDVSAPGRLQAC